MSRFPLLDAEIAALRALPSETLDRIGENLDCPYQKRSSLPQVRHEVLGKLLTLAQYLADLPEDYSQFQMAHYMYSSDKGWPTEYEGGPVPCGFAACAIGHAPAALGHTGDQLMRGKDGGVQWLTYAARTFGRLDSAAFDWMFGGDWEDRGLDNTPEGAAARIVHLLACVRDGRDNPDLYVNMDDMFAAKEIDAYGQLLKVEEVKS